MATKYVLNYLLEGKSGTLGRLAMTEDRMEARLPVVRGVLLSYLLLQVVVDGVVGGKVFGNLVGDPGGDVKVVEPDGDGHDDKHLEGLSGHPHRQLHLYQNASNKHLNFEHYNLN